MNTAFLGISPPQIERILLPIVIIGIIGFLICYAHRFCIFIVLPIFAVICILMIDALKFFTDLLSNYMLTVYATMILALVSMFVATWLSIKRYNSKLPKLK